MLTKKQHELLMFIDHSLREFGVSPSFDEMKDALDLKSKSGIHRLVTGLEERGFIRRLPHRARALEVLKLPENTQDIPEPNLEEDDLGQVQTYDLDSLTVTLQLETLEQLLNLVGKLPSKSKEAA